jgi:uncharacterized protein YigA (DUF484 family)
MQADDGPLASNAELHGYLLQTADTLTRLGQVEAAKKVRSAAAQAAGLSTEFLGESRNALAEVLRPCRRSSGEIAALLTHQASQRVTVLAFEARDPEHQRFLG